MQLTAHHIDTHYQDMGRGHTIILLHGWGCDWQIWGPVIPALSDRYRLVIPDLPAFGKSAVPQEVWDSASYETWLSDFIEKILEKNSSPRTTRVTLIGHSFGGKLAALYAAHHPRRIQQIVLVDSSGLPDPLTPRQIVQQNILKLIPKKVKAVIPRHWRLSLLHGVNASTDHFTSNPQQQAILKKVVRENISHQLEQIEVPSLIIWGTMDKDTPLSQGKAFAQLISGAQLATIADAGHFPFLEKPDEFLTILSTFLDQP